MGGEAALALRQASRTGARLLLGRVDSEERMGAGCGARAARQFLLQI
jgi:hypothetical protein